MKEFLAFVKKESWHILRDKRTMLILLVMPVVLMLIFGFAIRTDVQDVRTVIVTSSADNVTQRLSNALGQSEYFDITGHVGTPAEAERLIRSQKADIAIVFSQRFASGKAGIQIITDGADPNMAQQYSNYVTAIMSGELQDIARGGGPAYTMHTNLLYNPQLKSAYNFVPAIMGMLLMLVCAMMTSISIVREKENGTMEVLLVSPVRPIMIIIAKAVPYVVIGFVILCSILLMSKYVLGVPLAGSILLIVGISAVYIMLALSLGLLISTIAKTQLAALMGSAVMLLMPSVMLSGMMFPIESMPEILQWLAAVIPPQYYISAMRKLMIMGTGFSNVAGDLAVLVGMTVLFLALALKKFNKRLD